MSTYYYDLKHPWGNAAVETTTDHCRLTLWDNHGSEAGSLTLRVEDGHEAVFHFFREDPVCLSYYDGQGKALCRLKEARTAKLVDEYGNLTTMDELMKDCYRSHDLETAAAGSGAAGPEQ